jgi:hypothetical protein
MPAEALPTLRSSLTLEAEAAALPGASGRPPAITGLLDALAARGGRRDGAVYRVAGGRLGAPAPGPLRLGAGSASVGGGAADESGRGWVMGYAANSIAETAQGPKHGVRACRVGPCGVRYAVCSVAGADCRGAEKQNQDSWIVLEARTGGAGKAPTPPPASLSPYLSRPGGLGGSGATRGRSHGALMCGVFDGHGTNGKHASATVAQLLPRMLIQSPQFADGASAAARSPLGCRPLSPRTMPPAHTRARAPSAAPTAAACTSV